MSGQPMSPEPCEHHWIHYGQPSHSPIRWIVKCSQCNQFKIADLQEQVDVIEAVAEQRGAHEATVEAARILREIAPESDTPLKNLPGNIPVYIWLAHRSERYRADQMEGDE